MCENAPYKQGSNVIMPYTAEDSAGAGITGLTVKFSIYKPSTSKYWDDGSSAFNSVGEVLNTASPIGHGLYEYEMTGGYDSEDEPYQIRVQATQSVTGDIADKMIAQGVNAGGTGDAATSLELAEHDVDIKLITGAIKLKTDSLPHSIRKNTAIPDFKFIMLDAVTGNPTAEASVTASRKLDDDATWSSMVGTKLNNGDGAYSIDINAVDTDCGAGVWKFTAPGAKTTFITFVTEVV